MKGYLDVSVDYFIKIKMKQQLAASKSLTEQIPLYKVLEKIVDGFLLRKYGFFQMDTTDKLS